LCDEIEGELVAVAVRNFAAFAASSGTAPRTCAPHDRADTLPERGRIAQPVEHREAISAPISSWPRFPSFGFA
jgi:hypothetical protein